MFLKNIFVYPRYPKELQKLFDLAYNLWSLWDSDAVRIFNRVDSVLFKSMNKNPVELLNTIPEERLKALSQDDAFLHELERVWGRYTNYLNHNNKNNEQFNNPRVAYFSMEYGLPLIPNYAGGLGILSGDHLKGASDLSIPIIGVGLFYKYGYFNQRINLDGVQEETYRDNNIYYQPIKELKTPDDQSAYITLSILNTQVRVKLWYIEVGKVKLVLLDTNIEENPPEFRTITDYLYVADRDSRIMQEIVLGFGGIKALEAIYTDPVVFHLNEGHSAFLIIERLKKLIQQKNYTFEEAFALIKSTSVFTTHTAVESGNENFPVELIKKYLERDIESLGIKIDEFLRFGFLHDDKTFWLPAFAIRFSRCINGVSNVHSEVSKRLWSSIFPKLNIYEIPIVSITNGIHHSWLSNEMRYLFECFLGPDYIYADEKSEIWEKIRDIPDEEIWDAHMKRKREMIAFLRNIVTMDYTRRGFSPLKIKKAQEMLNAKYLTIGFARRFAAFKRPTLILKDKERLQKILTNPDKPIQLIFSGKAHPADLIGKNMIMEIIDFAREYALEDRVLFIENYERSIAEHLVQGVDVWLNNPIKPLEASGTSGMKAGTNGVLNLSVLDGWWPECYNGKNGWAITAGELYENPEMRDAAEANQIYDFLEEEITDLFYDRDEKDMPREWVKMMKESIYSVAKSFNINVMVSHYDELFYKSSMDYSSRLLKGDRKLLKETVKKYHRIKNIWDKVYIKDIFTDIEKKNILLTNDTIHVECFVYLDEADFSLFDVELFYFLSKEKRYETVKMKFVEKYLDKVAKYDGRLNLKSSGLQSIIVRLVPSDNELKTLYPDLIKWKDS